MKLQSISFWTSCLYAAFATPVVADSSSKEGLRIQHIVEMRSFSWEASEGQPVIASVAGLATFSILNASHAGKTESQSHSMA